MEGNILNKDFILITMRFDQAEGTFLNTKFVIII